METRKTIFDYLGEIFCLFGITMASLMVITCFFGESAQEISTMFELGKRGITLNTMFQFFVGEILICGYRILFFSDIIIKKMSVLFRTIGMVVVIIITLCIFILLFGWFPANMWLPWIMFFLCFGLYFSVSMGVMLLKTKMENKKMEEGLKKAREQWKEDNNGEE